MVIPFYILTLIFTASILKRYESRFEKVATANHAEVNCGKHAYFKSHAELLLMLERNLEGPHAMEQTLSDLVELEKQLDAALTHVRARKIQLMLESVKSLHDQFVCVQFYMNEALLLSTGKDADRRKPAARETDCCINEGRQRLGSHSG
ncbi:SERUM RESPONSE FACTOR-like protein [Salix purpurea]|uniref:SERUM RESPONSE FACTOR-like protein n=1 Tax=Salix purpurea TaxID=77065 RepID=A0A9Q0QEE0_SALPP|nr:SERUM RESPONSE FACTOR-like protein [Salix purpurea]